MYSHLIHHDERSSAQVRSLRRRETLFTECGYSFFSVSFLIWHISLDLTSKKIPFRPSPFPLLIFFLHHLFTFVGVGYSCGSALGQLLKRAFDHLELTGLFLFCVSAPLCDVLPCCTTTPSSQCWCWACCHASECGGVNNGAFHCTIVVPSSGGRSACDVSKCNLFSYCLYWK